MWRQPTGVVHHCSIWSFQILLIKMESATIKKTLLFSKTESTSKTESNIIFCMIALACEVVHIFWAWGELAFAYCLGVSGVDFVSFFVSSFIAFYALFIWGSQGCFLFFDPVLYCYLQELCSLLKAVCGFHGDWSLLALFTRGAALESCFCCVGFLDGSYSLGLCWY